MALFQNRLDERRLQMLNNIKSEQLQDVCQKMREIKLAGYQERIVDRIVERIIEEQER